jgi:molecular chaperone HtpG
MYVDPMSIYREYVQNAADSIDEARDNGTLPKGEPGRVDFTFDPSARTVRIRDNGAGVAPSDFVRLLTSFGASKKRGRGARGFRGVGRLAGIGYCQELIFRSRAAGEKSVCELRWDCRKLKSVLRATEFDGDLNDVVMSAVAIRQTEPAGQPEHFFEVELRGIIRHRNDHLLDPSAVDAYLAQVAPVPFSPEFTYGAEITSALRAHVKLGELEIRLQQAPFPVYRPHRNQFELGPGKPDKFNEVELITIPGVDGSVAAVGWVLHHGYAGSLPAQTLLKGIRIRVGNIQVGDDRLLEELFAETRFNGWSVGELHVIDVRVVPNGRRDHFEQNVHYHNLLTHMAPIARDLSRRCRVSSIRRNRWREFVRQIEVAREKLSIVKQGSLGRTEQARLLREVHAAIAEAEKLAGGELFEAQGNVPPEREIQKLRREVAKVEGEDRSVSPLAHVPKSRRQAYQQVFSLIYECAPNRTVAKAIVDRIMTRL